LYLKVKWIFKHDINNSYESFAIRKQAFFFIEKNSLQNNIFFIITILFFNFLFTIFKNNMYFKILYLKILNSII